MFTFNLRIVSFNKNILKKFHHAYIIIKRKINVSTNTHIFLYITTTVKKVFFEAKDFKKWFNTHKHSLILRPVFQIFSTIFTFRSPHLLGIDIKAKTFTSLKADLRLEDMTHFLAYSTFRLVKLPKSLPYKNGMKYLSKKIKFNYNDGDTPLSYLDLGPLHVKAHKVKTFKLLKVNKKIHS